MRIAFWKRRAMAAERIIVAASILAENMAADEPAVVAALVARGFSPGEAHRLVAFLPLAFSQPIVEEFGATIAPKISIRTAEGGSIVATLVRQPEYVGALALAREHRRSGRMDQEIYKAIVNSSAEIDALSNALNAGAELSGAVLAAALVGHACSAYVIR
ncbi:MAG: hypothetical protein JWN66_1415 [Sphingomonas bacterium]|uniref:hypothetical protein n=1 Tax=Sphingomonas bacterium TaxID=1895847 RepID=UPI0026214546|nr:hypothetical protein [Sphingomonas bacterium]MDB5704299.1 hypothetical protein [Sphingomonas bacterium]